MWKYVLKKMIKLKEAVLFIVMIILSFAVSSVSPYLNGAFIDLLSITSDIKQIIQVAIIIGATGILGALLSYFANLTTTKILSKTTTAVVFEGLDNVLATDLVISEQFNFSYLTQRLFQDANVISSFVLSNFLSVFLNAILIIGVLCCFFMINPLLCLFVIAITVPYIALFCALKKPLLNSATQKKEADTRFFCCIFSIMEQVFDIQLNDKFTQAQNDAQKGFMESFPFTIKAGRLSYLFSSIDSIIQIVFQAVLFVFAGVQIAHGNMTIGEFVMIIAYFSLLLKAVKYYTSIYKQYQDAFASYKRVNEMLAYPKMSNGEVEVDKINSIDIKGMDFQFPNQNNCIFNNASCTFKKCESYSIIGENGEGKSTFFKIIATLYGGGGSVFFNNVPASRINTKKLRRELLSCVPQKLYASHISVRDFLSNNLGVDTEEVLGTLENTKELFGYAQFLKDVLDQSCNTLSGGELRKLYIWIAAVKSSDVLLLDEPTTDLDAQGQAELSEFLKRNSQGRMIIVMTHDPNLITLTQHVISVRKGDLIYEDDYSKDR